MSPEVVYVVVLLAALAHAVWNALLKGADDPLMMMAAIRAVGLIVGLAILPFVPAPSAESWPWLLATAALHYAYFALLLLAYRVGDMSLVYPLARGTVPLILAIIAFVLIGERLTLWQSVAVALTSAGIVLLALGRGGRNRAAVLALATAGSIAAYSFVGGVGVRLSGSVLGFQAWVEVLTSLGVLAYVGWRRRPAIPGFVRAHWATGAFAGLISVGSYFAYLLAVLVMPLAPVAALRESGALFGAVIGTFVFKEAFGRERMVAAALVSAGIVLLGVLSFGAT